MKNLIYTIALFSAPLFFGITAILDIKYEGSESSSLYRNYCIIIFTISMLFILFGKNKYTQGRQSTLTYWVLFLYIFIGFISGYTKDSLWLALVSYSLPAACIGKYYAHDRSDSLFKMAKWLDMLFVILTVSVFSLSMRLSLAAATNDSEYSQRLSYYSALCFLLDMFLLLYGKSFDRLKFFRTRFVSVIYYCLLPAFIMVIFFAGGRGGFVVVAVGTIAIAFLYRKAKWKSWLWGAITVVAVSILFSYISENASNNIASTLDRNQKRVLAYIKTIDEDDDEEGYTNPIKIDMSKTSGRDKIYSKSWNMFLRRPLMGYGLFRYKRVLMYRYQTPYPHNLFLEWLLQGGILFFCIWFYAFCKMLIRLHRLIKNDRRYIILLPFLVYAIIQLMFTGTYMNSTFFWFALSFTLNKRGNKHRLSYLRPKGLTTT